MAHVVNALVAPGVAVAASQPARGSKNYCNAGRPAIVAGLSSKSSISAPTSAVDAPVVLGGLGAAATRLQAELRIRSTTSFAASAVGTSMSAGTMGANEEGTDSFQFSRIPTSMAALGSVQGVTLQKGSLDMSQETKSFEMSVDDSGGGGNNGGKVNNGGGGDGDDGDDDDYFDDFDGDDEGDNGWLSRRAVLPELFDRQTLECVLSEWYRSIGNLPAGIRMAVEMGLVSSAQLMRFLSLDARPTVVRAVTRNFPAGTSRAFVGRLMGDPAFLVKMSVEQAFTAAASVAYEYQQRGDRFTKELDLVAANTLTLMATNAVVNWAVAPSRSFGATHKHRWQGALADLPNNIFDKSGPLREFTNASRASGFLFKAAELSAVGMGVGAVGGAMSNGLVALRRKKDPSYIVDPKVPAVGQNALGMGAFAGLSCNLRYQLLAGIDRSMFQTYNSLGLVVASTTILRGLNVMLGEPTRRMLCGQERELPMWKEQVMTNAAAGKRARIVQKFRGSAMIREEITLEDIPRPRSRRGIVGRSASGKLVKKVKKSKKGTKSSKARRAAAAASA